MVLPVAQQGEDHTPHAFHGEFPDPTDSLCRERWPQTCHILSCIPPLQALCSPAPVPPPHFGFPVPQQRLCLAAGETEAAVA